MSPDREPLQRPVAFGNGALRKKASSPAAFGLAFCHDPRRCLHADA
jgi:hypothetical protein